MYPNNFPQLVQELNTLLLLHNILDFILLDKRMAHVVVNIKRSMFIEFKIYEYFYVTLEKHFIFKT